MACEVKEYFIVPDDWIAFNKSQKQNSFIIFPCHHLSSQLLRQWIHNELDYEVTYIVQILRFLTNIIITFCGGNSLSKWINKYTSKCICITWENSHLCGFWLKNKTIMIRTKTTCCHATFSNTHTNGLMHICWYYHTMYTIIITLHWLSLLYTSFSLNIMLPLLRFVGLDITQAQERLCKDIKKNHISSFLIDIDPPTLQTEGSMN